MKPYKEIHPSPPIANRLTFLLLLLAIGMLSGCQPGPARTFAGFTFGGGGNTFSAEPAILNFASPDSTLVAGESMESDVYLELHWKREDETPKKSIPLERATVVVKGKATTTILKDGHIVLQAGDGTIQHGSFELTTKSSDGREYEVVGSFTATIADTEDGDSNRTEGAPTDFPKE